MSIGEYYRHTADFSSDFFDGRIDERDRESSEATLEMTVGKQIYRITRGMFEADELRNLEIVGDGSRYSNICLRCPARVHGRGLTSSNQAE